MSGKATKRNRRKLQRRGRELAFVQLRHHLYTVQSTTNYSNVDIPPITLDTIAATCATLLARLEEQVQAVHVAHVSRLASLDLTGVRRIELNPEDLKDFKREPLSTDPLYGCGLFELVFGKGPEFAANQYLPRGCLRFDPPARERRL